MKVRLLFCLIVAALLVFPQVGFGQNTPPPLGLASGFAIFTAVGAIDNNGPSVINGDIGTNAGAFNGFPPGVINGVIHVADTRSTQAATAVQGAYGHMSALVYNPVAFFGGTPAVTLTPGAYTVGGAYTMAGTLILDGGNNPNATFYLQVTGALTTAQNSQVLLTRGANANNVYWQIGGLATLGQNSVMQGTLLVDGGIILIAGAQLTGRGLSRAGGITLTSGTASLPGAVIAPAATSTSWLGIALGGIDTNWFDPRNWSVGVPTSTVDAIVGTGRSPYPVLVSGNALANGLTIGTGASLTLNGGTLDLKAGLSNSGTISATAGTTSLSGTTATQLIGGSGSTQLWDLRIANAAGALQSGAVSVHGVLAPASGNLTTNGQLLTLLSDATGTALVDNTGTGLVNGNATVQRYISSTNTGPGYRHYSAPVSNSTVADLATPGFGPEVSKAAVYNSSATPGTTTPFPTVFGYDQARVTLTNASSPFDRGFVVPASLAAPLAVGRGYAVNIAGTQLVDFVGALNNGDLPLVLNRNATGSANATDAGWQLLGNPYPAPLNYALVAPADRLNLDAAIYVYVSTGPYTGNYRSYANGVGGNPVLPVGQGFFARVSSGQTTGGLTFRNSQRLTAPDNTPFQRTAADARPLVQLELRTATGLADALYAYAQTGATAGFDAQFDALKLPNTSGLNLASVASSSEALAIDGRPAFSTSTVLPLAVGVPAAGSYSLAAAALNNLPAALDVVLVDALTGQTVNLRQQPTYAFAVTAAQAAATSSRFTLTFVARTALATAAALTAAEITLYPNPAHAAFTVLVPATAGAAQLHADLLNALGQVVRRQDAALPAAGARLVVDAAGLAAGVYTLRLQVGATAVAKRVVLQ